MSIMVMFYLGGAQVTPVVLAHLQELPDADFAEFAALFRRVGIQVTPRPLTSEHITDFYTQPREHISSLPELDIDDLQTML